MKRLIIFLLTGVALLLSACELEHVDNGHLDGLWKLQAVDTLSNGKRTDTSSFGITYAVQAKLFQLRGGQYSALCRFSYQGDSLVVYDPYSHHNTSETELNNTPITEPERLAPYGFSSLRQTFHIEQLTGKRMVLRTEALRLWFEKY